MTAHSTHAVLPLALVAGAMVLTAAACGGADQTPATTSPSTSAATAASSAPTAADSPSPNPTTSTASPTREGGGIATCTVGDLRIRYADDRGGAGAGSVVGAFTFTNTGAVTCTLSGFPGISYVGGGNGTQVGEPATRTGDAVKSRSLAPGKSVKAALRRTQPGNYGDECQETKVDGIRVYPPSSKEAAFVAFKTTGCKSTSAPLLQVGPVS